MSRLFSIPLAAALSLAGCGDAKPSARTDGAITVFAASSLTGAFTDIGKAFETAHPHTKVHFNFAASSALVQQIRSGASADVVATADVDTIGKLFEDHFVRTPKPLARNVLVIVTQAGNPSQIKTLGDLANAGTVALCAADVPCGSYAAQLLENAQVTITEAHVTRATNVAAALTAVSDGDATAAIVYATDAKAAAGRVDAVAIPDAEDVMADYPIARLRATSNAAAQVFIDFAVGGHGVRILERYGFLPA